LLLERIDKVFSFAATEIKEVQIKTISTPVKTIVHEDPKIKVHLYGTVNKGALAEEIAHVKENILTVEVKPKKRYRFFNFNMGQDFALNLELYLPADYKNNLCFDTVSGSVDTADLFLNRLEFHSISGGLWTRKIQTKKCKCKTSFTF